jgi:hypothetical protein
MDSMSPDHDQTTCTGDEVESAEDRAYLAAARSVLDRIEAGEPLLEFEEVRRRLDL